jgi:uncharacterized phage protein (TIGR01671 family)
MNSDRFKFRAWDGKKMHYDFIVAGFEYCDVIGILWDEVYAKEEYNVQEWKVMQCIGLKDAEGKFIYEGDIVEIKACKYCIPFTCTIVFKGMGFWFMDEDEELFVFHPESYHLTVIGNIYER